MTLIPNFAIIRYCRLGNQVHRLPHDCWLSGDPSPRTRDWLRIIYNGPHSRPHQVAFYNMQDKGGLLLIRFSTVILLLDLRPEVEHNFARFGDWSSLPSPYQIYRGQ